MYPRSFADTDGDGIGDLPGVTAHLDHLAWLGVDAVWLSPFYPSPMRDFGYDITDHTAVDPMFGTLDDFDDLVATADRLGLRVLVDYVPCHTSDLHPWFRASRSSRDDPRRDWYLWRDPGPDGGPPNNWRSTFGGPAWTLDAATGQYYYHAHLPEQPDLNWRNPDVVDAMLDVLRFWLDRGVGGFRVDALRHLLKDDQWRDNPPNPDHEPGTSPFQDLHPVHTTDLDAIHDTIARMRAVVDAHPGPSRQRVLIGELYLPLERLVRYYGDDGSGLHMPSNMHLISTAWAGDAIGALIDAYEAALPDDAWPNWVIGNHDRSRVASRVGAAQAAVAALLLLTLRGTPTLYYGDEIGMHDVPIPPDQLQDPFERRVPGIGVGRDPARTPMQWTTGPTAGFCPPGATPWLPLAGDHDDRTVAGQRDDPRSLLTLHRRLLAMRRDGDALAVGSQRTVVADPGALVYVRAAPAERLLVALNLTGHPRTVDLTAPLPTTAEPGRIMLTTRLDDRDDRVTGTLDLRADEGVIVMLAT